MSWSTNKLSCNGISCKCSAKQLKRENSLNEVLDIKEKSPYYKNNHNIRRAHVPFEYTESELMEYSRCIKDISYFYNKSQEFKSNRLTLRKYQEDLLSNNDRFQAIVNSRQSGITYILAIKALHKAFSCCDKTILIVSYNRESSQRILNLAKDVYQTLPFHLKPGVLDWKSKKVSFDNGCSIISDTNPISLGRGYDFVILDDYAHYPVEYMESIYRSLLPTLLGIKNSEMIISSTPNGINHFKDIVQGDNLFKTTYIHWSLVQERDESWKKSMIKSTSISEFAQEYENLFIDTKEWNRFHNLENLID